MHKKTDRQTDKQTDRQISSYIHIYIYVCMYVCMYIYICIDIFTYIYIYMCVCIYIYTHTLMYICIYVFLSAWRIPRVSHGRCSSHVVFTSQPLNQPQTKPRPAKGTLASDTQAVRQEASHPLANIYSTVDASHYKLHCTENSRCSICR